MRKFLPPFTVDATTGSALIIRDRDGFPLAYVYSDERSASMKKLTPEEAEGVARAIVMGLDMVSATRQS